MQFKHRLIATSRVLKIWSPLALILGLLAGFVRADSPQSDPDATWDVSRVDQLEQTLQSVLDENARLSRKVQALEEQMLFSLSEQSAAIDGTETEPLSQEFPLPVTQDDFFVGYENGIIIRPKEFNDSPYSLKINHQNTVRITGFDRGITSWVDSVGNVNPIFSVRDFAIPRGRLILSGNALLPDLSYLLNIDYNTVSNNPIGFRAFSLNYRFSRAFQGHVGQNKVPGTREWLHSSFDAQEGPDRSMATTFFRPSLSQGIWFTGEPLNGLYYHAMSSNGFNTLNVRSRDTGTRPCFSGSVWWEPWGDFGRGYSDIEYHWEPALRLGSSFTSALEEGSQTSDYPENTLVRLSDGTLITEQGALAPGVTLQAFRLSLVSLDVAYKYRGMSLSSEFYSQELGAFRTSGPIPVGSLQTYGGVIQGGYFICPRTVELFSRNSFVTGEYGSGNEFGIGFNWFLMKGKSNLRYTFDTAWLESSPADQIRTGFVAGQTGCLIRTQINSSF
jgi:hypothetical protein